MKVNISPSHPPSVSPPSRVKISVFISHPPLLSSPPQPWQVNTEYNQAVTDKSQVSKYLLHGFRHRKILLLCAKIYCIRNFKFNFLLSLIIIKHLTSPQIEKDKSNSARTKKVRKKCQLPRDCLRNQHLREGEGRCGARGVVATIDQSEEFYFMRWPMRSRVMCYHYPSLRYTSVTIVMMRIFSPRPSDYTHRHPAFRIRTLSIV